MSSRGDRLRAALEDTEAYGLAAELEHLPLAQVNLILNCVRASRKAGRADEAAKRRQRHRDRPRRDDDWIAASATAITKSLATRAGYTLETLQLLKAHYDDEPRMMGLAVEGARSQGYSDAAIGRALGVTPQAIGQRYGPRNGRAVPDTSDPEISAEPKDQLEGWVTSGHARCPDPPEGCGRRTEQWNGKGPAVIHHGPGCPVDNEHRVSHDYRDVALVTPRGQEH